MNQTRFAGVVIALALCASVATADQWNKKTILTFSGPFEVPGAALSPGTYVFSLATPNGSRNLVRITNERGNKTYATVLTIPDYRMKVTDKTVVAFGERAPGAPEALKVWFYPGDNYGYRFVYPKVKAMELAKVNKQPVPEETEEPAAPAVPPKIAQTVKIAEPEQTEESYKPEALQATDQTDVAAIDVVLEEAPPPQLPTTASPIHMIGVLGLLLLVCSASLRYAKVRMS